MLFKFTFKRFDSRKIECPLEACIMHVDQRQSMQDSREVIRTMCTEKITKLTDLTIETHRTACWMNNSINIYVDNVSLNDGQLDINNTVVTLTKHI